MSKLQFKSYNQGQSCLFPSRLDERIAADSPVRLISRIVDFLDLTELIATYESGGTTPYHPRMLLKVVFYAYMNNLYSCRRIASIMEHHIHYIWLSGSQYPSYSTINRFRSEHVKDCVNRLFVQVVMLLVDIGQVSLDVQYVDGTKMESVANKYTFVWCKTTERNKEKLQAKIQNILSLIEEGIAQDNQPEAVFGQMKFDMGYKRFRHRKFDKVQMDFGVFAMAFNLKKLCGNLLKKGLLAQFVLVLNIIRLFVEVKRRKLSKIIRLGEQQLRMAA